MRIKEFGRNNDRTILLVHPSLVKWDYFEYVIPLLEDRYRLVIPVLPGYDDEEKSDFTSIEQVAGEIEEWLAENGADTLEAAYGCSMGGSVITRLLADGKVKIRSAVVDGGITPYRLPWIITRFIALRDYLLIMCGKVGGIKILEKAFSTDEMSEEDIKYVADVLSMVSSRTVWRTFDSTNNYSMPEKVDSDCRNIEYWFTDIEEKDRDWDIRNFRRFFPQTRFLRFTDVGHGGLAPYHPERFVKALEKAMRKAEEERENG